jgi:hypothetical protein
MKTLKQILSTVNYTSPDNERLKDFVKKHEVEKTEDANGNKDDVFQATNVKYVKRKPELHGYDKPQDEKVHEELDLDEKTLTKAEMKKREEIAQAMERDNPGMPMGKKMAIATATAKKVAEETTIQEDLIDFYFALDEEQREEFITILKLDDDDMLLEYVESFEEQ